MIDLGFIKINIVFKHFDPMFKILTTIFLLCEKILPNQDKIKMLSIHIKNLLVHHLNHLFIISYTILKLVKWKVIYNVMHYKFRNHYFYYPIHCAWYIHNVLPPLESFVVSPMKLVFLETRFGQRRIYDSL